MKYTSKGKGEAGEKKRIRYCLAPRPCLCTSPCSSHFRFRKSLEYPIRPGQCQFIFFIFFYFFCFIFCYLWVVFFIRLQGCNGNHATVRMCRLDCPSAPSTPPRYDRPPYLGVPGCRSCTGRWRGVAWRGSKTKQKGSDVFRCLLSGFNAFNVVKARVLCFERVWKIFQLSSNVARVLNDRKWSFEVINIRKYDASRKPLASQSPKTVFSCFCM